MGLDEAFHQSWYQSKGGGGDDPEESTQRMIERIWESLIEIRMRMDQQAPVPLVTGEAVPVALVPPPPGVEVPFVAPVTSSPPVIAVEEPVVQIESTTGKKGAVQDLAVRWDFGFGISDAVHGTEQGRGKPEVEESQQSTARQPILPPGYRCSNCNQPGPLIRNCPYPREYGYGRGVQQPQQSQQPPRSGQRALGRRRSGLSRPSRDATICRVSNRSRFLSNPSQAECSGFLLSQGKVLWRFQLGFGIFGVSSLQGVREKQGKRREIAA
ncbi:hypothetical protein Taro_042302 [Colocasia esculenta]|uniref:CCHC-type domain-containing protein n=1 Tax=Colocasia esculenta TaxID=4460 RepID=A0A843WGG9_COLES|nr:hypothetical protein [Colocasia esculenta]